MFEQLFTLFVLQIAHSTPFEIAEADQGSEEGLSNTSKILVNRYWLIVENLKNVNIIE